MTSLWAKAQLNIFLSFINHSFEEGRKILRRKQHEGSTINIKLIQHTFVNSNMQGTRHFVRISECSKHWKYLKLRKCQ